MRRFGALVPVASLLSLLLLLPQAARAMPCLEQVSGASRPRFVPCTAPPPWPAGACHAKLRGVAFELPVDGRQARIWVGPADRAEGAERVAIASRSSPNQPPSCTRLDTRLSEEEAESLGVALKPFRDATLPIVHIQAFGQSGCSAYSGGAAFACFVLEERCDLLLPWTGEGTLRGSCGEADAAPSQETRAAQERAEAAHRRGLEAFRHGRWKTAERLFQSAADASLAALNDLGLLYFRQRRFIESERVLLQTLVRDRFRPVAWLHLADLYWETGHHAAAASAYAAYLRALPASTPPGTTPAPAPRAVERAASSRK